MAPGLAAGKLDLAAGRHGAPQQAQLLGAQRGPAAAPPRKINCAKVKCIALTFDDGPVSGTDKLLKILAKRHVRATFFLVGQNAKAHPDLVRKELAAGHEVGNHSYTHADLTRLSSAGIKSEITKTQTAIRKASGFTPHLLRPPYGSTNSRVAAVTKRLGMPQIIWAVDPLDWRDRNSATVERRVIKAARPGYIVLMHDIHPTTVNAVPTILSRLAAKGYVFVTVSELFGRPLKPGKTYAHR
ncbi:polysaccharide deacetylase family protein [Actinomadura rupiterrae]|uniref:polysaccharide deacetylase family protein n=1 Tax=Actinomadura rupiterrae TaxID=559627 RepID=UPI0020A48CEC|nr:polysaccharide deacetylase family protein [Actinomadura rupiterrae]MCP2343723.1 peptidoglycan/xylan/chitin deacetylase (PgdA/CDA1 family) [Actinomadura rupiterrae]